MKNKAVKTDLIQYLSLLTNTNVHYTVYDHVEFLCDKAVKKGATVCINIRDNVDLYFDINGSLVGSGTNAADSFEVRKDLSSTTDLKVFAYRNLNRKGVVWSLKDLKTKRVIDRVHVAYFKDVELKVSEAGRQRVLKELRKNVHAGVKGSLLKTKPKNKTWIKASYNPYTQETFVDANGNQVHKADYAILDETGLWITISPE